MVPRADLLRPGRFPGFGRLRKAKNPDGSSGKNSLHARESLLLPGRVSQVLRPCGEATGPSWAHAGSRGQVEKGHCGEAVRKRPRFRERTKPRTQENSG